MGVACYSLGEARWECGGVSWSEESVQRTERVSK